MSLEHWMSFGTFSQQRYFVYPTKDTYTGVLINANMVAWAPDGMAAFLLEKTATQTYLIDPQTHAFQHPPSAVQTKTADDEIKVKGSIQRVAEAYGAPFSEIVGQRPLLPGDLTSAGTLASLVENTISFQRERLPAAMHQADANKYLNRDVDELRPYAYVAPYFFMQLTTIDDWLPLGIDAATLALEHTEGHDLIVPIVIGKGVLQDPDRVGQLVDRFGALEAKGFLLWVDNLDEVSATKTELSALLQLASGLRTGNRTVVQRHGGYFSILAGGTLAQEVFDVAPFSAVAHGPEYGEFRGVVPVGGGIPHARYYVPSLHMRAPYRDAVQWFQKLGYLKDAATFHDNVCDCPECRRVIDGDIANFVLFGESTPRTFRRGGAIVRMEFPTGEATRRCLRHYLHRKRHEFSFSATASVQQIRDDLIQGASEYKGVLGQDGVSHLETWPDVF